MQLKLFIHYCLFMMPSKNRTQGAFLFVVALSPFDFTFPLRRNPCCVVHFHYLLLKPAAAAARKPESDGFYKFKISHVLYAKPKFSIDLM